MATFSFAEGGAMFDSTPIENLFLLEYLPAAPEAFLRVYLYTRVLALHPELGGDAQQMARALHMEEDAVYEAFAYWEQQGLVRRLSDRPPTYELISPRAAGAPPRTRWSGTTTPTGISTPRCRRCSARRPSNPTSTASPTTG